MTNIELEVLEHRNEGFKPLVNYKTWRVSVLNDTHIYYAKNIGYFERHNDTDEVFVLLKGSCKLLLAGKSDKPENIWGEWMLPEKIYNVKNMVWHTHILFPGSSVLVIENSNTSAENTDKYYITETIKCIICNEALK